ncbi:hypothetical protein N9C20_02180 [Luminiphilus sp.]|nr:hypothetical protein [Luminiphilus sp.]
MSKSMGNELQLALAVCGHDGLISEAELAVLRDYFCAERSMTTDDFDNAIDEFFSSDAPLELLLSAVENKEGALRIAESAATADGLDLAENWALLKCRALVSSGLSDL